VRWQPREYSGWQVPYQGDEVSEIVLAERTPDSLVQFLPGEPALDKA
jgi:hypothetical protein